MATKLFVGGLSWGTTDAALRDLFAQVGNVVSATIISDKYSGKSKGFGFVEMGSEEEAAAAIAELNGKEFDGRSIIVSEARPQAPRENRGGFGGGRDRRDGGRRDSRGGGRSFR